MLLLYKMGQETSMSFVIPIESSFPITFPYIKVTQNYETEIYKDVS